MSIYVDVLFAINVLMNSIILLLTAWASGIKYKSWRILLAAASGGVYVLSGLWPELAYLQHALFKAAVSLLLIFLAFGVKSIRTSLLLTGIFYIVSFILGGAVMGWIYFWQNSNYLQSGYAGFAGVGLESLLKGTLAGVILAVLVMKKIIDRRFRKGHFYCLAITYQGRKVELTSLLDTGNCLYTMTGRRPVVLIEYEKLAIILSSQVNEYLRTTAGELWLAHLDNCQDQEWLTRIQAIPYKSVGNTSMLLGFRPDRAVIVTEKGAIAVPEAVLGIYHGALSNDGTYAALLHPALINTVEEVSVCA